MRISKLQFMHHYNCQYYEAITEPKAEPAAKKRSKEHSKLAKAAAAIMFLEHMAIATETAKRAKDAAAAITENEDQVHK